MRRHETRLDRFLRLNPERQRRCEAEGCGEARVVEMAHKPFCKRNGRNPSGYVQGDEVWLLCPTCHRLIDYGIETPASLGLPE